uniref:Uncharacterized protein n=1 Tax=Timema genevievae TaxID=629358 RepID=A0A7R9PNL1_TIMGE|nr:unnamed protein product [Timema genevievae]
MRCGEVEGKDIDTLRLATRPVTGTGPTGPIPENFPRSRLHYPYARCLDKLESTYTRGTPKNHVRTSEPGHQEEDSTYNQPAPTRTAVKSPTIKNTINSSEVHHHPNSASLLLFVPAHRRYVEPWFLEHFSPADEPDKDGLYSRALGLRFQLDKRHFNNPLELKCSATVGGRTWDRVVSPGLATLTNQKLAQESLRRGPDVGHLLPGNCVTARCPEVLTLTSISTTATDKQLQQNIIKRVHSIRQSPHFTGKYSKHGRGNWYRFQNTVKVSAESAGDTHTRTHMSRHAVINPQALDGGQRSSLITHENKQGQIYWPATAGQSLSLSLSLSLTLSHSHTWNTSRRFHTPITRVYYMIHMLRGLKLELDCFQFHQVPVWSPPFMMDTTVAELEMLRGYTSLAVTQHTCYNGPNIPAIMDTTYLL